MERDAPSSRPERPGEYSDEALERGWLAGNVAAEKVLFERYRRRLHRLFRSRAGEQADDLVQQTFTAALEGHRRLRGVVTFRAYLFGTARFQLFGYFRRRRAEMLRYVPFDSERENSEGAAEIGCSSDAALLGAALEEMAQKFRIVVTMAYIEERTAPEIAAATNLPLATVYSRLRRGKKKLLAAYAALAHE